MSNEEKKTTVSVGWLDDCPACGHGIASVTGSGIDNNWLHFGDAVLCDKCGHAGEIDVDGENAWVDWEEVSADEQ
ncbi:hypothetical protein I5Q39_02235 [Serratia marcescens]|nr:hypothetical protein [Serratia marcescens]